MRKREEAISSHHSHRLPQSCRPCLQPGRGLLKRCFRTQGCNGLGWGSGVPEAVELGAQNSSLDECAWNAEPALSFDAALFWHFGAQNTVHNGVQRLVACDHGLKPACTDEPQHAAAFAPPLWFGSRWERRMPLPLYSSRCAAAPSPVQVGSAAPPRACIRRRRRRQCPRAKHMVCARGSNHPCAVSTSKHGHGAARRAWVRGCVARFDPARQTSRENSCRPLSIPAAAYAVRPQLVPSRCWSSRAAAHDRDTRLRPGVRMRSPLSFTHGSTLSTCRHTSTGRSPCSSTRASHSLASRSSVFESPGPARRPDGAQSIGGTRKRLGRDSEETRKRLRGSTNTQRAGPRP